MSRLVRVAHTLCAVVLVSAFTPSPVYATQAWPTCSTQTNYQGNGIRAVRSNQESNATACPADKVRRWRYGTSTYYTDALQRARDRQAGTLPNCPYQNIFHLGYSGSNATLERRSFPSCPSNPETTCTGGNSIYEPSDVLKLVCSDRHFAKLPAPRAELGACETCVGNPINPATGNKFQKEVDYRSGGIGGLNFERWYNSYDAESRSLGTGWTHNFDRRLILDYGLPMSFLDNSPQNSTLFATAQGACEQGWEQVKSRATGLANTIAVSEGGQCNLYEGATLRSSMQTGDLAAIGPVTQTLVGADAIRSDGKGRRFVHSGGIFTPSSDVTMTLILQSGVYKLTDGDTVETYDSKGRLTSIADRAGYVQTLTYVSNRLDKVVDSFGRQIRFTYNGAGKIEKLIDPANQEFVYTYVNGNLSTVRGPDLKTRTYHYEDANFPSALTKLTDENSDDYATWSYDAAGRAINSSHAGGVDSTTLTYNADGTTSVQDALGTTRVYTFTTVNGVRKISSIAQPCVPGCGTSISSTTYDANGFVDQKTDFNGNVTDYAYNARGLEESRTEAYGTLIARTITTQWHGTYRLPTQIDESNRRTVYAYDAATGNRLTQTVTDLATLESRATTWTYTTFGRVQTVNGPRTDVSDVTTYAYYACTTGAQCGQVQTVTNALGHVTTLSGYDAHGNPLTIVDPNSVNTTLTYDLRRRLKTRTVAGALTSFDYDDVGQLDKVTLPDRSFLDYTYDSAHRLTDIEDSAGNKIHYTLDLAGNHTDEEILDPGAVLKRKQSQVYNALGRLQEIKNASGQVVVDYAYDAQGNRTGETAYEASANFQTVNQHDALNRMWRTTAPDGGITQYSYNARDQLVGVTDPKSLLTTYVMNALNFLAELVSPDTGVTGDEYDAAGNLTAKTDARGVRVEYSYDALNRLTLVDYDGTAEDVTYSYDSLGQSYGKGRLTSIQDAAGTLALTYDARGNVTQEQRVIGGSTYTTSYSYDVADRVTSITYPSGRIVTYGRNSLGQVATVTTTVSGNTITLAQDIAYMPFGSVKAYTLGNGVVVTRTFDTDYRLQDITDAGTATVQHLDLNYDRRGNVTLRDDLVAAVAQTFAYDEMSRLTSATGAYGTQGFIYDDVGNRLTQTGTTPESYNYSSVSHQLTSLGSGPSFTYDDAGNATAKGGLSLTYNEAHRSATVSLGGVTVTNTYGASGQRLVKAAGGLTTVFQYDRQGQLIAEQPGSGPAREYVWLESIPLAQTSASGLGYFHVDQLNTPQKMSDASQTVVWQAGYEPFGGATITSSAGYDNPLRFPGQYFDAETGLHQNWHRDYDPSLGRYLQSDPIGLVGGVSTYGYVSANPLGLTDRRGLLAEDYYAAEQLVRELGQQTGAFKTPDYYLEGLSPLKEYLEYWGETTPFWDDPANQITITGRFYEKCMSDDEAQKLLEAFVHETLHFNQSRTEQLINYFLEDDSYENSGGGYGDDLHDSLTRRARYYASLLNPRYQQLRRDELQRSRPNKLCECSTK